jgi:hypothetical protein
VLVLPPPQQLLPLAHVPGTIAAARHLCRPAVKEPSCALWSGRRGRSPDLQPTILRRSTNLHAAPAFC